MFRPDSSLLSSALKFFSVAPRLVRVEQVEVRLGSLDVLGQTDLDATVLVQNSLVLRQAVGEPHGDLLLHLGVNSLGLAVILLLLVFVVILFLVVILVAIIVVIAIIVIIAVIVVILFLLLFLLLEP